MSTFEVKVRKITVAPHPDADLIEVGKVDDYQVIVGKGQFKTGDLVVYIPEAAIVPDWLIERMGLVGKLAGSKHNRVRAVRLRGVVSQGLCYPVTEIVDLNIPGKKFGSVQGEFTHIQRIIAEDDEDDVAEFLGIEKYEPIVPAHMAGEVCNLHGKTLSYDIENIKKYPDVIQEGELVEITEKIHGTWACFGQYPFLDHPEIFEGNTIVTSKGLSDQGLAFKFNEANANNLYINAFYENFVYDDGTSVLTAVRDIMHNNAILTDANVKTAPFYLLCEIFGAGVQDLGYGFKKPVIRLFDIYVGVPGSGRYLHVEEKNYVACLLPVLSVPTLYIGPYRKELVHCLTSGTETVSNKNTHLREGVVITPVIERRDMLLGRVKLKSISDAYLLRKNKNATEYT